MKLGALALLAGCDAVFDIHALTPPVVSVVATHRWVDNDAQFQPALHETPFTLDDVASTTVRFADGSTSTLALTETGFRFERPTDDMAYDLDLRIQKSPVTFHHDAETLRLRDTSIGRPDRIQLFDLARASVNFPLPNGQLWAQTTGVWEDAVFQGAQVDLYTFGIPIGSTLGELEQAKHDRLYVTVHDLSDPRFTRITGSFATSIDLHGGGPVVALEGTPTSIEPQSCVRLTWDPMPDHLRLRSIDPAWANSTEAWGLLANPAVTLEPHVGHAVSYGTQPIAMPVDIMVGNPFPAPVVFATDVINTRMITAPNAASAPISIQTGRTLPTRATLDCTQNALTSVGGSIGIPGRASIGGVQLAADGIEVPRDLTKPLDVQWALGVPGPVDAWDIELLEVVATAGSETALESRWKVRGIDASVKFPTGIAVADHLYILRAVVHTGVPGAATGDLETWTSDEQHASMYSTTFTIRAALP